MQYRSESSYLKILSFINKDKNVNPNYIVFDFEMAAISAANKEFSESCICTCLFHFGQNIWREVQKKKII
jgi:hypothetical protein